MASIYNIDKWDEDYSDTYGDYRTYDIVKYGEDFYYCILDHTSDTNKSPTVGSIHWNGVTTITAAGITRAWPYFFWAPAYNVSTTHQPRLLSVSFGDGYEQRMPDGLNHDILEFSLVFDKRDAKEATSIIHFLAAREGYKAFYFKPPQPYGVVKKFVCKSWNSALVYDNNYTVNATFSEKS